MSIKFSILKKKKLIVFVKNKLITMDTILPLLIEMKQTHNIQSDIVVMDKLAHNGINKNVVIRDGIQYVGKEMYITKGESNTTLRRFYVVFYLLLIIYDSFRGGKLIHFGALDQWPLKILGLMFKKNVYRMQGNAYNFGYSKYKKIAGNRLVKMEFIGDNVVSFGNKNFFSHKNKTVFEFGPTRSRDSWLQYIYNNSDYYFNTYHPNTDLSKGIIVVIMSSLDGYTPILRDPHKTQVELFVKTLDILSEFSKTIPIFIKPHVYTNMELLNDLISGKNNINVTYLHPSVLATKSKVFIANQFSNTLADAHTLGVTTIEYTDYANKILKATKGKSIDSNFVSYFINNDIDYFKNVIINVLNKNFVLRKNQWKTDHDESGLLLHLST